MSPTILRVGELRKMEKLVKEYENEFKEAWRNHFG